MELFPDSNFRAFRDSVVKLTYILVVHPYAAQRTFSAYALRFGGAVNAKAGIVLAFQANPVVAKNVFLLTMLVPAPFRLFEPLPDRELANRREPGPFSALFPEDVQKEAAGRYDRIQRAVKLGQGLGVFWLVVVLASLAILVGFTFKERQGWRLWLPGVIAFGPLGLLMWLVLGRRPQQSAWRIALVEALGDLAPTIFAYIAFLSIAVLMPAVMGSEMLQLLLLLGLPLLVGLKLCLICFQLR